MHKHGLIFNLSYNVQKSEMCVYLFCSDPIWCQSSFSWTSFVRSPLTYQGAHWTLTFLTLLSAQYTVNTMEVHLQRHLHYLVAHPAILRLYRWHIHPLQ